MSNKHINFRVIIINLVVRCKNLKKHYGVQSAETREHSEAFET